MAPNQVITHFDNLPEELRVRIASYVAARTPSQSAIALGNTSPRLRHAVVQAHDDTLLAVPYAANTKTWLSWHASTVRKLVVVAPPHPAVFELFEAAPPRLERLSCPDHPAILAFLTSLPALSHLTLQSFGDSSFAEIISVLASLQLKHLTLVCSHKSDCPLKHHVPPTQYGRQLAAACPQLESLDLQCPFVSGLGSFLILSQFKHLKETTVRTDVSHLFPNQISWSGCFTLPDTVHVATDVAMAAKIGTPVVSVVSQRYLRGPDLASLAACPRLKQIDILLTEGAEDSLPQNLTALQSVRIRWCRRTVLRPTSTLDCEPGYCYHAPDEQSLMRMFGKFKHVHTLSLGNVRIPLPLLTDLLRSTGAKLCYFETSIEDQGEPPLERLTSVLEAISSSCEKLHTFRICDGLKSVACVSRSHVPVSCDELDKLHILVDRLHCRFPRLNAPTMHAQINKLFKYESDGTKS